MKCDVYCPHSKIQPPYFPLGDTPRADVENEKDEIIDNNEEKEEKKVEDDDKTKTEEKDESNESVDPVSIKDDSTTFSDLEELLFCRSPNQVKVR